MVRHSYITPKARVRRSGIDQKGVFAVMPICKGEVICVWGGYIITQKEFGRLAKKSFRKIEDYATVVAEGFYLVSSKKGGLEDDDFFNHSCEPNAGMSGQIMMVAMRRIRAGEEITYDYCMTDAGFDYSFDCACGKKLCRKRVSANDWKRPELQKRYKGYFSWHIQRKISRNHSR